MNVDFEVPDSVPLSKVRGFLAELGLPMDGLIDFRCGMQGVYLEVAAKDAAGKRYVNSDRTLAVHHIAIPLDRES